MDNISASVGRLRQNGAWAIAALIGLCEHDDDDDEAVEFILSSSVSLSVDGGGVGARDINLRFSEGGRCNLQPDILLVLWIVYCRAQWEPSQRE